MGILAAPKGRIGRRVPGYRSPVRIRGFSNECVTTRLACPVDMLANPIIPRVIGLGSCMQ